MFPFLSPAHTRLNFLSFPSRRTTIVLYQLQLTTSQVGLREISDRREANGSFCASTLLQILQPQAPLRACPGQHRETPGQTTETLPAADCLMLTAERIQAKGGGIHQALLHYLWHFPEFESSKLQTLPCKKASKPDHILLCYYYKLWGFYVIDQQKVGHNI